MAMCRIGAAFARVEGIDFPEAAQAINDYPIVMLAKAPQGVLAREYFIQRVLLLEGMNVLTKAGFEAP